MAAPGRSATVEFEPERLNHRRSQIDPLRPVSRTRSGRSSTIAPLRELCFLNGVCDGFFQIAHAFLQLAFGLLLQPLGLLLLAPH